MDAMNFFMMAEDKHAMDLNKMKHKYKLWFEDYIEVLNNCVYEYLPINDFSGNKVAYVKGQVKSNQNRDLLLNEGFSFDGSIEEIYSTSKIENIEYSKDSIKRVVQNKAPRTKEEKEILGIKQGLEFINDPKNKITEENLFHLYELVLGDSNENNINKNKYNYRDAPVYVVSEKVEHTGLNAKKLPKYMKELVEYVNTEDDTDTLTKASILHFYFAYLHPYFDGNGRLARMLHLWFLLQNGYTGALYVPFSKTIQETKSDYYKAFTLIEENYKLSRTIDVTPFILYFQNKIYPSMTRQNREPLDSSYTLKESELWDFINKNYQGIEFTTKRLEKDFGNVAFATVRSFCLKLANQGLLAARKQSNKVLYKIK